MKKILTMTLGLALVFGMSTFASDDKKKDDKKEHKDDHKKKKDHYTRPLSPLPISKMPCRLPGHFVFL